MFGSISSQWKLIFCYQSDLLLCRLYFFQCWTGPFSIRPAAGPPAVRPESLPPSDRSPQWSGRQRLEPAGAERAPGGSLSRNASGWTTPTLPSVREQQSCVFFVPRRNLRRTRLFFLFDPDRSDSPARSSRNHCSFTTRVSGTGITISFALTSDCRELSGFYCRGTRHLVLRPSRGIYPAGATSPTLITPSSDNVYGWHNFPLQGWPARPTLHALPHLHHQSRSRTDRTLKPGKVLKNYFSPPAALFQK